VVPAVKKFFILCLAVTSASAQARAGGVEIIDSRTEAFRTARVSATFRVENYRIRVEGIDHFGTRTAIQYETPTVSELEQFAVVQFYRGCQFGSQKEGKILDLARWLFGEIVVFQAKRWLVDSVDVDPVYNSPENSALSRHHYYRWSTNPDLFSSRDQTYYGQQPPTIPKLHVTDRPGQAWYDGKSGYAKNISLELETCLLPTAQIPRVSTPEKLDIGERIHCFSWRSSFLFDHPSQQMTMPQGIDAFCEAQ
jgi:hypothetical protein